jgi:hypothetical protein
MTGTRILPSCPGWVRPSPSRGPSRQTGTYLTGALAPSEPSNAGAATDPDWTTYEIPEAALAVMYPSSWARSTDPLMPNLVDPSELVALSTFPARPGGENRAHMPENAIEDMADRCSGRHPGTAWRPRRRHSRGRGLSEATRTVRSGHRLSQRGGPLPRPAQGVFDRYIPFSDSGRRFYAYVALGAKTPPEVSAEAWTILDRLEVERK